MKKENIKRYPEGLITIDGKDINPRQWNQNGNPICTVPGCNRSAHNKGKDHGGFDKKCKVHQNLVGKNSYKHYKHDVPYCENKDGRLGFPCTSTITHSCQLGVDHIDENRDNEDRTNYQTLCACCDRYKTTVIGKKVKSGKLSVTEMKEYFEINKRIQKGTNSFDDKIRRIEIDAILNEPPKRKGK